MPFGSMLLILFAFSYLGIGIGTILKFSNQISGLGMIIKFIFILPIQTILLSILVYFEVLPDVLKNCKEKNKDKNGISIFSKGLYLFLYTMYACFKFMPIMTTILTRTAIEKQKSPRHAFKRARNKSSEMIGELIACN